MQSVFCSEWHFHPVSQGICMTRNARAWISIESITLAQANQDKHTIITSSYLIDSIEFMQYRQCNISFV